MVRLKKIMRTVPVVCALLVLIIDTKSVILGAQSGIDLCMKTLIPSLLPFFVISAYFCQTISAIRFPFLKHILKLCAMPSGTESLLVIGMLGGYPVGAKAVTEAYSNGQLDKGTARRLLGFCSNAGPAFVFGVIGNMFESRWVSWLIMLILIASSIITGVILPSNPIKENSCVKPKKSSLIKIFEGSIRSIAYVCGWVILFRVFLTFLNRWFMWILPDTIRIMLTGIFELSNGCLELRKIGNEGLRMIISSGLLSFGGLCIFLQTASVTGDLGLGDYFPGKILQSMISIVLSTFAQYILFDVQNRMSLIFVVIPALLTIFSVTIIKKCIKNNSSIFKSIVV